MYIESSGNLGNYGILNNFAAIDNQGSLLNPGTLNNNAGAVLWNDGGTLTNSGTITGAGVFKQTAGGLDSSYGGGSLSQAAINILGGTLWPGTITGPVSLASGACIRMDASFGLATINGDLTSSGNFVLDNWVAGTNPHITTLHINGAANFSGGNCQITFTVYSPSNIPKINDSFDFLYANSISGGDTLSCTVIVQEPIIGGNVILPGYGGKIVPIAGGLRLVITKTPASTACAAAAVNLLLN